MRNAIINILLTILLMAVALGIYVLVLWIAGRPIL